MTTFNDCPICDKPKARNALGMLLPIHDACRAGKPAWVAWYEKQPEGKRTEAGRLLYEYAKKKQEAKNAKAQTASLAEGGKVKP